jgi:hypothetical protein
VRPALITTDGVTPASIAPADPATDTVVIAAYTCGRPLDSPAR